MSNYLLMIAFAVGLVVAGAVGLQVDQSKGHFMSANLIHRDSPMSPFYNSSKSQSEILGEAVTRSLDRINRMNSPMHVDAVGVEAEIFTNSHGDYFVHIHSGEEKFLMLSMESALTWIDCSSSETKDRLDSYKMPPYDSMDCLISPNTNRLTDDQGSEICQYETSNLNNEVSKGVVSQAVFHLDRSDGSVARFDLMFGCSHSFIGVPLNSPVQGIIGLGYGDFPFVAQLAAQLDGIKEKISYCLPPYHSEDPVKIIFGEKLATKAVIANGKRVTLPFTVKTNSAWYYLTLQSVRSYGVLTNTPTSRQNMVIDFRYSMTTLDEKIFKQLVAIMSAFVPGAEFKVTDPEKKFEFCYDKKDEARVLKAFEMQFHFEGGILTLREENIFADHMENLKCMMIKPTKHGPMVLGSYAQINHLVEFDLKKDQISLVQANCLKELGT